MEKRICLLFLICIFAVCPEKHTGRSSRNTLNKEYVKVVRSARTRTEVFENLFNIYDPTYLSFVWPKISNGVHLFLEQRCWDDLKVFFKDLSQGRAWAYSAVDASGRYHSSLFRGNRFWLGSKDQCLQLDNAFVSTGNINIVDKVYNGSFLEESLRKKYFDNELLKQRNEQMKRVLTAEDVPPHSLAYTTMQMVLNITKISMAKSYNIVLGVCLPTSCMSADVASIINFSIMINDNLRNNKTVPRTLKVTSVRRIEKTYNVHSDVQAISIICITLALLVLSVLATIVDLDFIKWKVHKSEEMSFDLQRYNNNYKSENSTIEKDEFKSFKESSLVDLETLTINNMNNSNNVNLVMVKKMIKANELPPSITLDVVTAQKESGSCKRCGKYKKQCNNPKQIDNLPSCPRVQQNSVASSCEYKRSVFSSLIICFSLRYSWKRIFNTKTANRDLSVVHGLRILATLWIIFVHVSVVVNYVSENGGDINDDNNVFYILATGTLAFDTLFFVSGLFSSHHFFYLKSRYTVMELVGFGGACGHILQYICFVTNRAVRLLPTYVYAVFLTSVLAKVSQDTSALATPERDYNNCDAYWWRNILYVTTFYSKEERCMQVSWFLSAETQLHAAAAFVCAALYGSRNRLAFILIMLAVLSASAVDISAAYSDHGASLSDSYSAYTTVIERPWARVVPYFAGVLAGWLVHRLSGRLKVSKVTGCCLWFASIVILSVSSLVPWLGRAWLSSWLHLSWPLALLWPSIICATVYVGITGRLLDSPLTAALSRLSYSMVLLHGAVIRFTLLSANLPLCSNTLCIWWYFAGTATLSVLGALLLSLLVEMPCCSLLRRLSDFASTN